MVDLKQVASKWQSKWKSSNAYNAKVDSSKEKFFITTPYPYISGSLHIGHGRSVVETDILARFKRLKGFNVLFPLGFHITGTPVLGISSAIENKDEKMLALYKRYVSAYVDDEKEVEKIVDSFKDPQAIVDFFIPKMIEEYYSLGAGIDWRRSFTSGDTLHQKLVEWQFKKFNEMGLIRQADYPVLYCPADGNAMGEDDIKDADSNPVEKQEFTLLKFLLKEDVFLVAGTLRPETVYGQTNLWVDPNASYVKLKNADEHWIMSKDAADKYAYQNKNVSIIETFKGSSLIGSLVNAPFKEGKIPVLPGSFVKADRVTGIVTSVPSDAPYDLQAIKDLKSNTELQKKYDIFDVVQSIDIIPIIKTERYGDVAAERVLRDANIVNQDDPKLDLLTKDVYREGFHNGVLTDSCGKYAGMKVNVAKETMKNDLISKGEATTIFETSRPAFSRSGAPVIVATLSGQWFIDFNAGDWKKDARTVLDNTKLIPDTYRKEFVAAFDWLDKRPCARKRGLGTKFPMDKDWIIESLSDSTLYMNLYTFSHLVDEFSLTAENLCFEFFEFLFSNLDVNKASSASGVSVDVLEKIKESWNYWGPCDQRHTYELHLSNHLSFMMFAHAAVLKNNHPRSISFHGMVMSEGTKMSKSKGNVISLLDIKNNLGADVFRFYLVHSSILTGAFDWNQDDANSAKKNLDKVFELATEVIADSREGEVEAPYYLSTFNKLLSKMNECVDDLNLRDYSTTVYYEIPSVIRKAKTELSSKNFGAFCNYVKDKWITALSPVTPHLAEELWSKCQGDAKEKDNFVFNESFPKPDFALIDDKVEFLEDIHNGVLEDIKQIKNLTGILEPKKIKILVANDWKYEFAKLFKEKYEVEKTASKLIPEFMSTKFKAHGKEVISLINMYCKFPSRLPRTDLDLETELTFLSERFTDSKFSVEKADDLDNPKAKKALPGKPALIIE